MPKPDSEREEAIQQLFECWKDTADMYRMAYYAARKGDAEGSAQFASVGDEARAEALVMEESLKQRAA